MVVATVERAKLGIGDKLEALFARLRVSKELRLEFVNVLLRHGS